MRNERAQRRQVHVRLSHILLRFSTPRVNGARVQLYGVDLALKLATSSASPITMTSRSAWIVCGGLTSSPTLPLHMQRTDFLSHFQFTCLFGLYNANTRSFVPRRLSGCLRICVRHHFLYRHQMHALMACARHRQRLSGRVVQAVERNKRPELPDPRAGFRLCR